MSTVNTYINSGILEEYVLGVTTPEETLEIAKMAALHPEIAKEIELISETLMQFSEKMASQLNPLVRTSVLSSIDFIERIKSGEVIVEPPLLHSNSQISDYLEWLNRSDMILPLDYKDAYAKVISANEIATTMIVWLKNGASPEVHDDQYERFLIVEGSCDITFGTEKHSLQSGDYLQIPLHVSHELVVTSIMPCKVVLQRVAA